MKVLKVTAPCTIEFCGCMWDEGWHYDAPAVLYSPFKRYTPNAGNSFAIIELAERIACDIVCEIPFIRGWHQSDLKEFAWRGWDRHNFARRKNAWHMQVRIGFYNRDGELHFRVISARERFGLKGKWERVHVTAPN